MDRNQILENIAGAFATGATADAAMGGVTNRAIAQQMPTTLARGGGGSATSAAVNGVRGVGLTKAALLKRTAPGLLAGLAAAHRAFNTPTEQYETRFALGPNQQEGVRGLARDVGVRGLGFASDLGDVMGMGAPGVVYRDRR